MSTKESESVEATKNWRRELEQRGQAIADAMGRHRGTEPLIEAVGRLARDHDSLRSRVARLTKALEEIRALSYETEEDAKWTWRDIATAQTDIARKALENKQ
jgi:hypothetical protein